MNQGHILLQFPQGNDVKQAITECEKRGYKLRQHAPASAIGFSWLLQRGKMLAALLIKKKIAGH